MTEVQCVLRTESAQRDQLQKSLKNLEEEINDNKPKFKECNENMHKVMSILQTCFGVGRALLQRAAELPLNAPLARCSFGTGCATSRLPPPATQGVSSGNDMYDRLSIMVKSGISDPLTRREAWFCGAMHRSEAQKRLTGRPCGTFLIRTSNRYPGKYALSVR